MRRHVRRHGSSAQDAQDVFRDALVRLYEQAVGGALVLTVPAGTYLVGIARHLWHHELRRRARLPPGALAEDLGEELPADPGADEPAPAVLDYMARLGERCWDILLAFYYFQQPLAQIAAATATGPCARPRCRNSSAWSGCARRCGRRRGSNCRLLSGCLN